MRNLSRRSLFITSLLSLRAFYLWTLSHYDVEIWKRIGQSPTDPPSREGGRWETKQFIGMALAGLSPL